MDFILHGYCGLYCGAYPVLLNTKAGAGSEQGYGRKSEQPTGYCADCCTSHSWWDETCPQCGHAVASYKDDIQLSVLFSFAHNRVTEINTRFRLCILASTPYKAA